MLIQPRSEEDHKNIVEQGFTLVELLIVIVIMGILAGIVVFAVGNLTSSANKNACSTEGDTFATAVQAYRAESNHLGVLPSAGAPASLQNVIDTLYNDGGAGQGVLSKDAVKYGVLGAPAAGQWGYTAGTGVVDTSKCS